MNFVGQILYSLVSAVHTFSQLVYAGFVLSCAVGQFLTWIGVYLWYALVSFCANVWSLFMVLYEDFCIFILDISNKITSCIQALEYLIALAVTAVQYIAFVFKSSIQWVCDIVNCAGLTVNSFFVKCGELLRTCLEFLKQSIILVGSGSWLALQLIPLSIVYIATSVLDFLTFLFCNTRNTVYNGGSSIINGFLCALTDFTQFFVDIPIHAYIGLVAGSLILYSTVKHRHVLLDHGMVVLLFLYRSLTSTLHLGWSHLEQLILHIATNQRDVHESEIDDISDSEEDSEASEDEEEDNRHQVNNGYAPQFFPTLNLRSRPVLRSHLNRQNLSRDQLQRQLDREKEEKLCIVCQDNMKCITLLPCRHLCLCENCCRTLLDTNGACPMCRHDVRRTLKVYL